MQLSKVLFLPFLSHLSSTHAEVMLQTVCMSPELLVNQNITENESCGYSPGQGSPQPGETASPKRHFQQSPSLPDSGLTELNVASPEIYPAPPHKPPAMSAPTGKTKPLLTFSVLCCFCKVKRYTHRLVTLFVPAALSFCGCNVKQRRMACSCSHLVVIWLCSAMLKAEIVLLPEGQLSAPLFLPISNVLLLIHNLNCKFACEFNGNVI